MDQDIKHRLARVGDATERLRATVAGLAAAEAAEPSRLPGWTRGHVLTHIARNADGLANLLRWARTGTRTPMYASREARAAAIEAGAHRPAAALAADISGSSAAFADEAAQVPDHAWTATVESLTSGPIPAAEVLLMRLSEVEIHHVDLGAGYGYQDWPDEFVADALARVAESFRGREDAPPCRLTVTGGRTYLLGPVGGGQETGGPPGDSPPGHSPAGHSPAGDRPAPPEVSGSAHDALAWLLGRDTGGGLHLGSGTLPVLPPWR